LPVVLLIISQSRHCRLRHLLIHRDLVCSGVSIVALLLAFNRQAVRRARYIRIEINYFASSDDDFIHLTGRCARRKRPGVSVGEHKATARLVSYRFRDALALFSDPLHREKLLYRGRKAQLCIKLWLRPGQHMWRTERKSQITVFLPRDASAERGDATVR